MRIAKAFAATGVLATGVLIAALPSSALADTYTETQITNESSPFEAINPVIKNGWIAWTELNLNPATVNVFVYNMASKVTTQVTSDGTSYLEALDGNTLVFSDYVSTTGVYNIFSYDLTAKTITNLTGDSSNQLLPSISGNLVVWQDDRNFNTTGVDIYGKSLNGGSEFAVTTDPGRQQAPSISGSLVSWEDDSGSSPNVYATNLSCSASSCTAGSEIAVAAGAAVDAANPRVDNGRIVYEKKTAAGFYNIFLYDASTGTTTQVSSCSCNETIPRIGGNLVVWTDDRNQATTGLDLYGKDLANLIGPDIAIDTEPLDQRLHDTDGTNVVFNDQTGNPNVFLLQPPAQVPFASFSASLAISPSHQKFAVAGSFTPGPGGTINPLTDGVTVQLGSFVATIPAGSFQPDSFGDYVFQGVSNGVTITAAIRPLGGNRFGYAFGGQGATNLPTANPVSVGLTIGNNVGSTTVNGYFF